MDGMNAETFRAMPFSKKIEWILQYYGVKIVCGLIAFFVAVYFVKSVFFAPPISDICVLMLTDSVTQETAKTYESAISEMTGKTAEVVVYAESDLYGKQAFAAKVGTDVTDLVIVPEEEVQLLAESQYLLSYAPLEGTDLYMGIPKRAREGEALQQTMEYMEKCLTEGQS